MGLFVLHFSLIYIKAYLYAPGSDAVKMEILTMQEREKTKEKSP